jgi:hypothetical protein
MVKTQTEWIKYLADLLPEGHRIYGLLRERSDSGMTKFLSLYTIMETYDGETTLCDFTWQAAAALHMRKKMICNSYILAVPGAGFCPVLHVVELLEKFLERELTYEVM